MAIGENIRWELKPVKLGDFEGPLDLLLYLIDRAKVDIWDIPIAAITDQYLAYVYHAEDLDIEEATSFVVAGAYLVQLKTKMMLPRPRTEETEEDPRAELARSLEAYKRIRVVAGLLREREAEFGGTRTKLPEPLPVKVDFSNDDLREKYLIDAYERVRSRYRWRREIESKPVPTTVKRERVSIRRVLSTIASKLNKRRSFTFDDEFSVERDKSEVVAAFMAILELSRIRQVTLRQSELFGRINVEAVGDTVDLSGAGAGLDEEM